MNAGTSETLAKTAVIAGSVKHSLQMDRGKTTPVYRDNVSLSVSLSG